MNTELHEEQSLDHDKPARKPNDNKALRWPNRVHGADNLPGAPLDAVLLYGLTLNEEDPALGVLEGARDELALLADLAEASRPGVEFDLYALGPVLERIVRRLNVGIELFSRVRALAGAFAPEGDL